MIPDGTIKYDHTGQLHLKHDIKVSVLMCTFRPDRFKACIKQLAKTCSNPENVEVLIKIDTERTELQQFQDTLAGSPFSHQILCSPKLNEYWSLYLFLNQLSKLARGDVFWYIADEMNLKSHNWYETLISTRNVYQDNIYLFSPRGNKIHPKYTGVPAISKEWFNTLGFLSPFPEVDVFLVKMAMRLQRLYTGNTIDFSIDKESWMLHDRLAWITGRNWKGVKKSMHTYIDANAHLFLAQMTDPLITPNLFDLTYRW